VDDHSSRRIIADTLKQPTRIERGPRHADAYLVLLRVEFTMPCTIAGHAVRSYRTLSPLPRLRGAVSSLLHWSSGYPAQPLAGTLPYVARTFLPCASVASVQRRSPSLPRALV